jgi:endonuclease-3
LPTDTFGTNLLFQNPRVGFINSDTPVFGWPTIAVDTHIFRVSNRTKLATGKNVDLVEQKLLKVVPAEFKIDVHHWLILHGRYTCIARKPRCGSCTIEDLCEFKDKTE